MASLASVLAIVGAFSGAVSAYAQNSGYYQERSIQQTIGHTQVSLNQLFHGYGNQRVTSVTLRARAVSNAAQARLVSGSYMAGQVVINSRYSSTYTLRADGSSGSIYPDLNSLRIDFQGQVYVETIGVYFQDSYHDPYPPNPNPGNGYHEVPVRVTVQGNQYFQVMDLLRGSVDPYSAVEYLVIKATVHNQQSFGELMVNGQSSGHAQMIDSYQGTTFYVPYGQNTIGALAFRFSGSFSIHSIGVKTVGGGGTYPPAPPYGNQITQPVQRYFQGNSYLNLSQVFGNHYSGRPVSQILVRASGNDRYSTIQLFIGGRAISGVQSVGQWSQDVVFGVPYGYRADLNSIQLALQGGLSIDSITVNFAN